MIKLNSRIITIIATLFLVPLFIPFFAIYLGYFGFSSILIRTSIILFAVCAYLSWREFKKSNAVESRVLFIYSVVAIIFEYSFFNSLPYFSDRVTLFVLLLFLFWPIFFGLSIFNRKRILGMILITLGIIAGILLATLLGLLG